MKPKWQKLASLCTLWFQFFGAVFASKRYPFKNIFDIFQLIRECGRRFSGGGEDEQVVVICWRRGGSNTNSYAMTMFCVQLTYI